MATPSGNAYPNQPPPPYSPYPPQQLQQEITIPYPYAPNAPNQPFTNQPPQVHQPPQAYQQQPYAATNYPPVSNPGGAYPGYPTQQPAGQYYQQPPGRSINVIFRVPDEELLLNGNPLLVGNIPYKRNVGHLGGW